MITYIIHTTSIWIVLFLAYKVLLSKEKYFMLNRVYLIASLALGLLLPLVQYINISSQQIIPEVSTVYHQQVAYISQLSTSISAGSTGEESINWTMILFVLISIGMAVMLIKNLIAGYKIKDLYQHSEKLHHPEFTEVRTEKDHLPFSFFRYIFFSAFKMNEADRLTILNHEIHHVRAKHTWDVLFVEAIKVLFWWNPTVYLYKKAITENHEYAADHAAVQQGSRKEYCTLLLQSNMPGVNLELGHPFFQTYIKKRIDMMYRKNTTWKSYLKFVLPMIAIVMMAFVIQEDEHRLELTYNLDSDYIDLYAGDVLLTPQKDYVLNREEGMVIISNSDYTEKKGISYCMYIVDEPRSEDYILKVNQSGLKDYLDIEISKNGTKRMDGKDFSTREVLVELDRLSQEHDRDFRLKVAVDNEVSNGHVVEFLEEARKMDVGVYLNEPAETYETKIPSIAPIAPKDILNKKFSANGFGMHEHPIHKERKFHKGVDLVAKIGTPIFATADGLVSKVESAKGGYGKHIIIDHDREYSSLYGHMDSYIVNEGDKVSQGDQIGFVGATGLATSPHLHYEVRLRDKAVDPIDYGLERYTDTNRIEKKDLIEGAKSLFGAANQLKFEKEKTEFEEKVEYNLERTISQEVIDNQISLGKNVVSDVIVKSNSIVLVEDLDYKLNKGTGMLEIINADLLINGNPIHVEFTSDEMDKIMYAKEYILETEATVKSDMQYDNECIANKNGVYFRVDKEATLRDCDASDMEGNYPCRSEILTAFVNANKIFPENLVSAGFEGSLIYTIVVDEEGKVESYQEQLRQHKKKKLPELEAEGTRLMELVKSNYTFSPAECDGQKVKSLFHFSIMFNLDDEQMERVITRNSSNAINANQRIHIYYISDQGYLAFLYESEMNVPYTIKVKDPNGDLIYDETKEYIYKSERDAFFVPNKINGTYKIEVTQDGQIVRNEITTSIFK